QGGVRKWLCVCACGTRRYVNEYNLLRGKSQSCGCRTARRMSGRVPDLTGQEFGALTVTGRAPSQNGRAAWLCRCACGNEITALGRDLRQGRKRSCGCRSKGPGRTGLDLTGRRFGRLTALEATEKRDGRGSVIWRCRCGCGQEAEVSAGGLLYGSRVSCGCLKREAQRNVHNTLHFVDGTCVEFLEKRRQRRDNASGHAGIYRMQNGKYRAQIGLQGKRYSLGSFSTYEEALQARLRAEEELFGDFLRQFKTNVTAEAE
ncbi:MAG: transcriptional regulator, partial [Clostridiales bacterium]|nr:transcriptional regulator [Clostridiales bacterium]